MDRADFGEAVRGHSFTYNTTNGVFGIISSNGVAGAFKAVTSDDEGSPGKTPGLVPLKITQQPTPVALSVPANSDITFTVAAQGLPHPHYTWRFNGVDLDGASQSSLTVSNAQSGDSGTYTVLVTNGLQTLLSSNAVLTVTTSPMPPTFTTEPVNADAFVGQSVRFTSQASGSPTPSLQWLKDGNVIAGATDSQLTLFNVQSNDAAVYTMVATNSAPGGSNAVSASLTVGAKPRLMVTEVHPSGSSESGHEDWWELTSFDTRTFNLKGWRWDDSSRSVAAGTPYVFPSDLFVHPGETVVFVEDMTPSAYRTWWGAGLPANLQIITYSSGGLGLSQSADEVNLWNAVTLPGNESAELVCGVNFAATSAGWTLVYDPENLPLSGVFSVASTNTVRGNAANGVFQAAVSGAFGSPGYVTAPITLTSQISGGNLLLGWNSVQNRQYAVEYKEDLSSASWNVLSNVTATAASSTIMEAPAAPARFYRVSAQIPYVPEP